MQVGQMYEECVRATKRFVHDLGFQDVIIGISGGIDSALVAAIAVDALGAEHVHGVMMPGRYSSHESLDCSIRLAEGLGIPHWENVSIVAMYDEVADGIERATGDVLSGVAAENAQARLRMVVLMAMSNMHGWLMLNTGNKSEACIGYSTLYGDMAGAFAPLGGLYKTQVREMALWRNMQAEDAGERAPIPQRIIDRPPSAELSSGQTDEDAFGMDYGMLDSILMQLVECGSSVDDVVAQGFPYDRVRFVADRYSANAFKRALEPPSPDVAFYG